MNFCHIYNIKVEDIAPTAAVFVGYVGENGVRQINVDCSAWLADFPTLSVSAVFRRSDGETTIPTWTYSDGIYTWVPNLTDTAVAGNGQLQLIMTGADGDVLKSAILLTITNKSLTGGNTPEPPQPDWVTTVIQAASEAAASALAAETSATNAAGSATAAGNSSSAAQTAVTHYPYINSTALHWFVWDVSTGAWVDTGVVAQGTNGTNGKNGTDGVTPHIGENNHWYIGDTDTGVLAVGQNGSDGRGIVSITRTSGTGAAGTTDTYTIAYTDGTTSTYTVYNGKDGSDADVTAANIETAIGYTPANDSEVVKTTAQTLTDAQKTQARGNIDAAKVDGNFELIEKIIVGYSITTEEPADWTTNWTAYYTRSGEPTSESMTYVAVTGDSAPVWAAGTYYSYDSAGFAGITRTTNTDGGALKIKPMLIKIQKMLLPTTSKDMYVYSYLNGNTTWQIVHRTGLIRYNAQYAVFINILCVPISGRSMSWKQLAYNSELNEAAGDECPYNLGGVIADYYNGIYITFTTGNIPARTEILIYGGIY